MGLTSQPWCTGPAHLFAGLGPSRGALYFGTTESTPVIDERPQYEPLMNDLGGSRIPFDWSYQGFDAVVTATMTRWVEAVWLAMRLFPRGPAGTVGTNVAGDIGSFMFFEGYSFPLWVVFPYAAKTSMATMPPGYRFYGTFLEGQASHSVGTRPRKINLTFYCGRIYNPRIGSFTCYDHIVTGLPSPS